MDGDGQLASSAIRVFGCVEIVRPGSAVRLRSRLRQALLAVLLVHQGEVVSTATLKDLLWPAGAPDKADKGLQVHVHRLRQALGGLGTIHHHPPGYRLLVASDRVDANRFEHLARRGFTCLGRGEPAGAATALREALRLYRGPAFQGLDHIHDLELEAHRLAEIRLAAIEHRITAELALGQHGDVVAELESLVALHPLRERFRAQLMTALYRAGRKGDALAAYRRGRQLLISELGVEPDAECQALARRILADDPSLLAPAVAPRDRRPVWLTPRQLPPDVAAFTGRQAQLRWLDTLLPRPGAATGAVVAVVDGMAGVGKTALAVHWGHRVTGHFPDGQLYADLRGHSPGSPLPPWQVLAGFLRELGLPADQVPADLAEASARYRSLLADRRILVVLDNVVNAEQVRPLLPSDAGCLVLVTSRHRLPGLLGREGAHRVELDPFTAPESEQLLARLLDPRRVADEPGAVADLASRCGHLPLALRLAAAGLAVRPRLRVADWLARLDDQHRLATLAAPDDRAASVSAAFDLSYDRLAEPARRVFRLIGLAPGRDITAEAVAALSGGNDAVTPLLDTLVHANLLEETANGRYTCHDLLRNYGAERARAEDGDAGCDRALTRLYEYYLGATDAAVRLLFPGGSLPPGPDSGPVGKPKAHRDQNAALAWLRTEQANLVAVVNQAAAGGPWRVAWQLAERLRLVLPPAGFVAETVPIARAGLVAARRDNHPYARVTAELGAAIANYQQSRYRPAVAHANRCRRLLRRVDWPAGEGMVQRLLGAVSLNVGRADRAEPRYLAALARFEQVGWRRGQAAVASDLAVVYLRQGRLPLAMAYAGQAGTIFARLGATLGHATTLTDLGQVNYVRGQLDRALSTLTQARQLYRAAGWVETEALLGLAQVHCTAGRYRQARHFAEAAAAAIREGDEQRNTPECLAALGGVYARLGDPRATEQFTRALAVARGNHADSDEIFPLIGLATLRPDGYAAARQWATRALELTRERGWRLFEGTALGVLAEIQLAQGYPEAALRSGLLALGCHRATGNRIEEVRVRLVLGRILYAAGDRAAAGRQWRRGQVLGRQIGAAPDARQATALLGASQP